MKKILGLPILAAIFLGWLFPYQAMEMMPFGIVLLFMLMLTAGFTIDWSRLKVLRGQYSKLLVGLFLLYIFFPLVQWFLADSLVSDKQLVHGLILASLCPVALVAPYFTSLVDGDTEFSFLLMVVSMILCPIAAPLGLSFVSDRSTAMDVLPLMKYMLLLVTLPLVLSYLLWRYLPKARRQLNAHAGPLSIGMLSLLIFILFGTAAGKLNLSYDSVSLLTIVLGLAFFQDFGVLFLSRFMLASFFDSATRRSLMVSLSMKNVAIAAGLLLFYDPRASLGPALVFLAHAFLFNFIAYFRESAFFLEKRATDRKDA